MSAFETKLRWEDAGYVDGNLVIRLTSPLVAKTRIGIVAADAGFLSDGSSQPQAAWSIVGHPFQGYLPAAVIHDLLYRKGSGYQCTRRTADLIFRDLMQDLGYGLAKRAAFYSALRLFGGSSWQKITSQELEAKLKAANP
jgi:hypothetical protein